VEIGTTIGEIAEASGAASDVRGRQAVLLGGYFGGWLSLERGWDLALDPPVLRDAGSAFGAGVIAFLDNEHCGVRATARIVDYMAGQTAAQCGPCVFGLPAVAGALAAAVAGGPDAPAALAAVDDWAAAGGADREAPQLAAAAVDALLGVRL
jgi:NADH:ubiquinone oxidoreductase subunit F (NADH-binding)